MGSIPLGQKFHTVSPSMETANLGSALANAGRTIFTMQDIVDTVTVSAGVTSLDGLAGVVTLSSGNGIDITDDGVSDINIKACLGAEIENIYRKAASASAGQCEGTVVKFGATTGMTAGEVYTWNGTDWVQVQSDAVATTKGLVGMALGALATDGLLTEGVGYLSHDPGTAGDILYIDPVTPGELTSTQPSTATQFVRIMGYCLADNKVFFSPSQEYIEIV